MSMFWLILLHDQKTLYLAGMARGWMVAAGALNFMKKTGEVRLHRP